MDDIGTMSGGQIAQNGAIRFGDKLAAAWFKREPKLMVAESEAAGRQVWKDVDIVYVQQPGDMQPVRREIGSMEAKSRWPEQWAAYQEGRTQAPDGTPVSVIFASQPGVAKTLESAGIHTVEQLAGTPDSSLHNFPFGGTLKDKAVKYLASLSGAEGFNKLQAQLDAKDAELKSMQMQLTEMSNRMAELSRKPAEATGVPIQAVAGMAPEQLAQMIAMAVAAAQPAPRKPGRPKTVTTEN